MALATLPISPAKPTTVVTTIPQFPHNPKTLILQQCRTTRDLNQVHADLIKTRLLLNQAITENILESAAILLPNAMDYALSIFHNVDEPDSLACNIMIRSLIYQHSPLEAILLFKKMRENSVEPDEFTFSSVLKACSRLRALREGEQIHAHIVKCGFKANGFIENTMIHLYASCGELDVARRVFDGLPERGRMAWNSMMAGYVPNTADARLDAEDDNKEASVSHHSKKLAMAFGLIRTAPGTTLRISKNLKSFYGLSQRNEDCNFTQKR